MQFSLFLLTAAAAVVAADATSTTATSATATSENVIRVTGTTLPELVTETEACAVLCYNAACVDSGCSPLDFACVCGNPESLVVKMGLCVGSDCDNAAVFDSGDWMASVCEVYNDHSPATSDVQLASSLLAAEISSAAATATDNPVSSTATTSDASGTATGTDVSSIAATATSAADASRPYGRWMAVVGGGAVAVAAMM